jgi:hypothetical protein
MNRKPISPLLHGIIDYAFSLSLISVPSIIKLNKKARLLYAINGISILSYSLFTKYPVAVKQLIPLNFHKKLDADTLALLLVEIFYNKIRRDKRAVLFHTSMLAAGIITVLLTDWDKPSNGEIITKKFAKE